MSALLTAPYFVINQTKHLILLGGDSFPTDVNPTSSARKEARNTSSAKSADKARDGRQLSGAGKRSQADIEKRVENDEEEPYRPPPGSMFVVLFTTFTKDFPLVPFCTVYFLSGRLVAKQLLPVPLFHRYLIYTRWSISFIKIEAKNIPAVTPI
jgi:hypothetical protein